MSSEWQDTTLGQICAAQGGAIQTGPFGSQLHTSDYKEFGIPVVMPTNIGDVTAFGLYVDNKSDNLRFDTYEVVVPEPGVLPLFSAGALLLGGHLTLRRRRRAARR